MEAGTLRLAKIAGGILAGLAVIAVVATFVGRRSGEVPVVQADERPIRVKPDNPGGMQIAGTGNDIFSGGRDTDGSKLAAAPENPDTKALSAQMPAAPQPAAVLPSLPPPTVPSAAPRVAAPTPPAPVKPVAQPVQSAAVKPVAAAHPTVQSGKAATIQLAALTSETAAKTEWATLQKRMPDLLGGHQPVFSKTERDGKVFWRVRAAGFTDMAQAKTTCDKVRAKGNACSVAEF